MVNPANESVGVVNAGPIGPRGLVGPQGGLYKIEEWAGAASEYDFTGILTGYSYLILELYARGTVAAADVQLKLRMNNDSGSNYDYGYSVENANNTRTNYGAVASSAIELGYIVGASAPSDNPSHATIKIPQYSGTTFRKVCQQQISDFYGTATNQLNMITGAGLWRSTSAIDRLTIYPSSGNFANGSVCSLYGMI